MIASIGSLLKGLVWGAGLMYLFDPDRGRRRRALIRDRIVGLGHDAEDLWHRGSRDLTNRTLGVAAETKRALQTGPVDDALLTQRVRAVLGHHINNARRLDVTTNHGIVTLRGTIRPGEPQRVIPAVERVPGVHGVESALTISGTPVPPKLEPRAMRPGTQLLLAGGGGLLMVRGLLRRGFSTTAAGAVGAGLLAHALINGRGRGASRGRVRECRSSAVIAAPVEKVYDFVSDIEQSDRFLPESVEVSSLGDGRLRWSMPGPGGVGSLNCEEVLLEEVVNERLVWASTDDSPFRYLGEATFAPVNQDSTRLNVTLVYVVPGGSLTQGLADLLGIDPQQHLDHCLERIQQDLEAATVPADATVNSDQ